MGYSYDITNYYLFIFGGGEIVSKMNYFYLIAPKFLVQDDHCKTKHMVASFFFFFIIIPHSQRNPAQFLYCSILKSLKCRLDTPLLCTHALTYSAVTEESVRFTPE